MRRLTVLRILGFTVAANAAVTGCVFAAADFHLERLTPREMHVAPGGATTYVLRIRNDGDTSDVAHLGDGGWHDHYALDIAGYEFVQTGASDCSPIAERFMGVFNFYQLVFDAGPIAPGSYLDCALTITRDADSNHDTHIAWGVLVDPAAEHPYQRYVAGAYIGTLTDVSVQTRTFHFHIDDAGFAHAIAELSVHNGGGVALDPMVVGACEDTSIRPFFTDGSGPGGCGDDSNQFGCFDWTYGFITPAIPAGETYHCLIDLTSKQAYEGPEAFPIGAALDFRYASNGLYLFDTNLDNDTALLRLAPDANSGTARPLSALDPYFAFIAGILLLVVGSNSIRKKKTGREAPFQFAVWLR